MDFMLLKQFFLPYSLSYKHVWWYVRDKDGAEREKNEKNGAENEVGVTDALHFSPQRYKEGHIRSEL
jgi:hypothetical protein